MLWEDVREQRQQRYQFRLGLIGKDPAQVRAAFPEEFETQEITTDDEEQIEEAIERELQGEANEWVTTGETPSAEEVTALLRQLTSGKGTMQDITSEDGWT